MELLYRFCRITQPEIRKLTGGIDYSAVSQARKRLQLKIQNEPEWGNKFNQIQNKLGQMSRVKIWPLFSPVNKIPYTYMLTLEGLEEKAKITLSFLKRKLVEYEEIKRQIKEIANEAENDETINLPGSVTLKALAKFQ